MHAREYPTNVRPRIEALEELREDREWSKEDMANAAGLSARNLHRIYKRGYCRRKTLVLLADALETSLKALLDDPPCVNGKRASTAPLQIPEQIDDPRI